MINVQTDITVPYTCNGQERAHEGAVRAIRGQLMVFNGSMWDPIRTTSYMNDLSLDAVVNWATKKMEQELTEERLAEQFPAFARAKENYETIRRLVENEMD